MNLHLPGDESEAKHVVSLFLQHSLSKTNNVSISKRNLHTGLETQSSLQVTRNKNTVIYRAQWLIQRRHPRKKERLIEQCGLLSKSNRVSVFDRSDRILSSSMYSAVFWTINSEDCSRHYRDLNREYKEVRARPQYQAHLCPIYLLWSFQLYFQ